MNKEETAWLAGLLEGEGCFISYKTGKNKNPSIRIKVKMTDKDVIEKANKIMPQSTWTSKGRKVYTIHIRGYKTQYEASRTGAVALEIMQAILPHMGTRRSAKIEQLIKLYSREHASHLLDYKFSEHYNKRTVQ